MIVRNLSYIPVTIEKVGFSQKYSKIEFCTTDTSIGQLPQMMQPRTSMRIEIPIGDADYSKLVDVHKAFVETGCNLTFSGDASVIRDYVKHHLNLPKS